MTERLADVEVRIRSVRQLSAVITAMRGIAAARSREARGQLDGIRTYARTIAAGIGAALSLLPEGERAPLPGRRPDGGAVIALCAEQGFAGAFSERVLDAMRSPEGEGPGGGIRLLVVGDRGIAAAAQRGLLLDWSAPMIAHAGQAAGLAGGVVEALYRLIGEGQVTQVSIVHAEPGSGEAPRIRRRMLLPFDFEAFGTSRRALPPLVTLPPAVLLARLAEEYVFAEIHEAIILSFAAENEARMRAMIAARTHVAATLDGLVGLAGRLRQDEITSEIVELAAGTAASRTRAS